MSPVKSTSKTDRLDELLAIAAELDKSARLHGGRMTAEYVSELAVTIRAVASALSTNAWRDVIPRCSWGGCNRIGTKWIARHAANCDEHGSAYLQDTPWAELARKEGL